MVIGIHAEAFEFLEREKKIQAKKLGIKRLSLAEVVDRLISQIKAERKN
jgi:hypothetical protein